MGLHCIGTSRDAAVAREVVSTLEALGYRPLAVSPKTRTARREAGIPHSARVAPLVRRLKLDELVSGRYPLERINEAIADTMTGAARRNVVVLR